VAAKKASGDAKDTLEVIDVAQLLARSVAAVGASVATDAGRAPAGPDANPGPPAAAGTGDQGGPAGG